MKSVLKYRNAILNNKVFKYLFSRYLTYFIQFLNTLLIAKSLGSYYMGIWGFLLLVIQYFMQLNFGIAHSFNAIGSIHKAHDDYVAKTFQTSFTLTLIVGVISSLFFVINAYFIHLGAEYQFDQYAYLIAIIVVLNYLIPLFSNLFRVYNHLVEVAFSQSSIPLITFITLLVSDKENLLLNLVYAYLIACIISVVIFLFRTPVRLRLIMPKSLVKKVVFTGWFLFLYNASFYIIMMLTRSFVSKYYTIEQFGVFSFIFILSSSVLLLLQSFVYLIFPKTINRIASNTKEEIQQMLQFIQNTYVVFAHTIILLAIPCMPIILYLFPEYQSGGYALFRNIGLTLILYTNCYGYSSTLIAKEKSKTLGLLALGALGLNFILSELFVVYLGVDYILATMPTTIAYLVFLIGTYVFSYRTIGANISLKSLLQDALPYRIFLPFTLSLAQNWFFYQHQNEYIQIAGDISIFILFLILNKKQIIELLNTMFKLINKPDIINI